MDVAFEAEHERFRKVDTSKIWLGVQRLEFGKPNKSKFWTTFTDIFHKLHFHEPRISKVCGAKEIG